jgi:hypothetical protein
MNNNNNWSDRKSDEKAASFETVKKISQKANLIMMNVAFFLNGFFVKVCSIEDKQRSHEWRGKDKRWPLATWTNEMVGISLLSSTNEQTLGRSLHSFYVKNGNIKEFVYVRKLVMSHWISTRRKLNLTSYK